jgi:hypothetical protein
MLDEVFLVKLRDSNAERGTIDELGHVWGRDIKNVGMMQSKTEARPSQEGNQHRWPGAPPKVRMDMAYPFFFNDSGEVDGHKKFSLAPILAIVPQDMEILLWPAAGKM